MNKLSVCIITKNSSQLFDKCLFSVKKIADEIIVVDDFSQDETLAIAQKYQAKIWLRKFDNFYNQRLFTFKQAEFSWILFLDSDEILSPPLIKEIIAFKQKRTIFSGFIIPFQNHLFEKKLFWGGENYQKLRLFNKQKLSLEQKIVHEEIELKDKKIAVLKNKIYHYSYRSLWQMFGKFTRYGYLEFLSKKNLGETSSFKKIIFYAPHMFWARFIKDKGYKDGGLRIFLDLGFAYIEFLTYFLLFLFPPKKHATRNRYCHL